MDDEDVERIMKDPNTWAWDGCTYSGIETKESWEDEFFENLKTQLKKKK